MIKYLIVLLLGTVETIVSTNYVMWAADRRPFASSIMMFITMIINVGIIAWAIKGADTLIMIFVYALSSGIGTFISIKLDKK